MFISYTVFNKVSLITSRCYNSFVRYFYTANIFILVKRVLYSDFPKIAVRLCT